MASPSSRPESLLIQLDRAYKVDEAINTRGKHIVIIRFGNETELCKQVDKWLEEEARRLSKKDAIIYAVQTDNVPELVARFELSYATAATIIFFLDNTVAHILSGTEVTQENFRVTVKKLLQQRDRSSTENGSSLQEPSRPAAQPSTANPNVAAPDLSALFRNNPQLAALVTSGYLMIYILGQSILQMMFPDS